MAAAAAALVHPTAGGAVGLRRRSFASSSRFSSNTPFVLPPLRLHLQFHLHPNAAAAPMGGDGDSDPSEGPNSNASSMSSSASVLIRFATENFLPLALLSGVSIGLLNPTLGCFADKLSLSKYSTFGIFFISGLTLRTKELSAAVEAWPAALFGLASILVLTPTFSRFIMQLSLSPPEFITGLGIFCCMPTTLSSGVTLTQLVGANTALALAMTVISNIVGILTVPLFLSMHIGAGSGITLPTGQLLKSLVRSLLIPLILGKILRETSAGVMEFVDNNRQGFSMASALLLSLVPWIQVSRSRSLLLAIKARSFVFAIAIGICLHLVLLAANTLSLWALSHTLHNCRSIFARKEYSRATILVASQKTLPVMVAVVEQLGGSLGESGLLVLPCVASHISQIIMDSILVNWWRHNDSLPANSKDA